MIARGAVFFTGLAASVMLALWWPQLHRAPSEFEIARQLLDDERPEDALLLLKDPMWRGIAEYRAGRYTRAIGEFFLRQDTTALYNIGTTYAQLEEWSGAIAALERVVRLEPEHEDARHNLDLVLKAATLEAALAIKTETGPQLSSGDGGERNQRDINEGDPTEHNAGDANDSEATSAAAQVDEAGNSNQPGELGEEEQTEAFGTSTASGNPQGQTEPSAPDIGGSMQLKARESAQAADILLREIRDDPAKVLRARLNTAHTARQARARP